MAVGKTKLLKRALLSTILILSIGLLPLVFSFQLAESEHEALPLSDYRTAASVVMASSDGVWNEYESLPERLSVSNSLGRGGRDFSELVIGFENVQPNRCSDLIDLVVKSQGEVVATIATRKSVSAIVAKIPADTVSAFVSKAKVSKWAKYIEPNVEFKADFIPNDPYWPLQWGPVKIQVAAAWNFTTGSASILVAVVDTGIDWNHPDLASNYAQLGYDWVNHDPAPMDDNGHGTHVAGTIAAVINNSIGIAGLANVRIMAEKVLDQNGTGTSSDVAQGIIHAVDSGAEIINLSLGGPINSETLREAVKYAFDQDVLVVAAAGNDATDTKHYPASYDEVVAVSATDSYDTVATFSNYGDWIDVAAPGVRIYSTVRSSSYAYKSGTSMASPHAAGVAALIWSRFPNMTRDQVWAQLLYTADDLDTPGFDVYYGFGRVNARKAVEQAPSDHDLLMSRMKASSYVSLGMEATIDVTILNMGNLNESDATVELLVNNTAVRYFAIGFLASGTSKTLSAPWNATAEGVYNVTAHVLPVPGETSTVNNAFFAKIKVGSPRLVKVPTDYSTIQNAVDASNEGDTILVASGTYYETVQIATAGLRLIGENRNSTFIDGKGGGDVVSVTADNVKIEGFTIRNSGQDNVGIWIISCSASVINDTAVLNSTYGIFLDSSPNTTLRKTVIANNTYDFGLDGEIITDFVHDIDVSNTVSGRPIYYLVNQHDMSVLSDAGYVAVVNSTNIDMRDVSLIGNSEGILFAYAVDCSIDNVTASSNALGIYLYESRNNIINDSSFNNNDGGIALVCSSNNTVSFTKLSNNYFGLDMFRSYNNVANNVEASNNTYGVYLEGSGHNSLRNTNMTQNRFNFGVGGTQLDDLINDIDTSNTVDGKPVYYWVNQSDKQVPIEAGYVGAINCANITVVQLNLSKNVQGLFFAYVVNSTVSGNSVAENDRNGIVLYYSHNNRISANELIDGSASLEIDGSNNNMIYHNSFFGNVEVLSCNSTSTWDNGYPSGGNYWSDYAGADSYSGLHQNESGSDGIGDTPYVIDANNQDNYPLMNPWTSGPTANFTFVPSTPRINETIVFDASGSKGDIESYAWNFGDDNMTTVTEPIITHTYTQGGNYSVTLNVTASNGLWNTTTSSVTVRIRLLGDMNGDETVDIYDALLLSGAFNSESNSPNWNPDADFNGDNLIDIYDAILLANNYGKTA